jgi:multiple sugar transport system substrate-binding protein
MTKFQIITLGVFVVCIIGGVIAFATFKTTNTSSQIPAVTVWGTFPSDTITQYVSNINLTLSNAITVNYVQKDPATFSQDFVAALARGNGPDAVLIPVDMLLTQANKLSSIPYTLMSQPTFRNRYVSEASLYENANGLMGIPFTLDPMVMYWNRDMFNSAGIATHPVYWDDFTALNSKLTVKDQNGNVRKSAVALGEFSNITNAREILGTLFMQSGNPVTAILSDGSIVSTVKTSSGADPTPALQFFTQFADPSGANYSWNKGLPNDKSAFLAGMLGTYFGFASEIKDIRAKNPNLNFDVTGMPIARNGGIKGNWVYGRMYGFSLVNASANKNAAWEVISILTDPTNLLALSATMYLPTVRVDAIAPAATDPYMGIFNNEALVAHAWLDASPAVSDQIFSSMVEAVTSGQKSLAQAIRDAGDQFDVALQQATQ